MKPKKKTPDGIAGFPIVRVRRYRLHADRLWHLRHGFIQAPRRTSSAFMQGKNSTVAFISINHGSADPWNVRLVFEIENKIGAAFAVVGKEKRRFGIQTSHRFGEHPLERTVWNRAVALFNVGCYPNEDR